MLDTGMQASHTHTGRERGGCRIDLFTAVVGVEGRMEDTPLCEGNVKKGEEGRKNNEEKKAQSVI